MRTPPIWHWRLRRPCSARWGWTWRCAARSTGYRRDVTACHPGCRRPAACMNETSAAEGWLKPSRMIAAVFGGQRGSLGKRDNLRAANRREARRGSRFVHEVECRREVFQDKEQGTLHGRCACVAQSDVLEVLPQVLVVKDLAAGNCAALDSISSAKLPGWRMRPAECTPDGPGADPLHLSRPEWVMLTVPDPKSAAAPA